MGCRNLPPLPGGFPEKQNVLCSHERSHEAARVGHIWSSSSIVGRHCPGSARSASTHGASRRVRAEGRGARAGDSGQRPNHERFCDGPVRASALRSAGRFAGRGPVRFGERSSDARAGCCRTCAACAGGRVRDRNSDQALRVARLGPSCSEGAPQSPLRSIPAPTAASTRTARLRNLRGTRADLLSRSSVERTT